MSRLRKITPCLWFDDDAEDAVAFYTGIFENSRIIEVSRYGKAGQDVHGHKPGSVMTIAFELDGQTFTALNGGPQFKFNEAISLQVACTSQQEIDYFWQRLTEGGDPTAQQCGWLKDKYGLSWQIVPSNLGELLSDPEPGKTANVMKALIRMKKLDVDALQKAKLNGQVEYPEFQN